MWRFASIWPNAADFSHHIEIILQGVPNREYALKLFVEDEEIKLQKTSNQSWTPAQRQYALFLLTTYTY